LISALLDLRKVAVELFSEGTYEPLEIIGQRSNEVCGFLRRHDSAALMVIVTRLNSASRDDWGNTAIATSSLQEGTWQDVVSGLTAFGTTERALVSDILQNRVFAVLHRDAK